MHIILFRVTLVLLFSCLNVLCLLVLDAIAVDFLASMSVVFPFLLARGQG